MIKRIILICLILFTTQNILPATTININTDFFNRFNDKYLCEYVTQAATNNHDLKSTKHKVEQYRQEVKISFSKELPSLSTGADYLGVHIPRFNNFEFSKSAFIWPFMASYEPDFLLKNRDKTKSTKKLYEASKEEQRAIYISLLGDVATNYINILQYDALISNQKEIVKYTAEQLERTQKKIKYGIIDSTMLNLVKQDLEKERNLLEKFQKEQDIILYNFAVLIGISPDDINDIERANLENMEYICKVPDEMESNIIFYRPDVNSIEKQMEKAHIDIRVARKEFLPSFKISGIWVFNTLASGSFFSWQNSLAALLAGTTLDLFNGGYKVANLKFKKAVYEELFEKYSQIALNSYKEVNTALCIIKYDTEIDNNTLKQLKLEDENFISTQKQYTKGTISYPDFLSAKKNLLKTEQNKIQTKTSRLVNYITLYKATGGVL